MLGEDDVPGVTLSSAGCWITNEQLAQLAATPQCRAAELLLPVRS